MRYNVGIDFGTHQTKVCIEDALNKRVPVYEFLEYDAPKGKKTVLLPSIVQVNKDYTLSYGFADPSNALVITKEGNNPPIKENVADPEYFPIPIEPKYESMPKKPESKNTGYLAVLEKLLPISDEMKKWKQECAAIERANENRRQAWINRKKEVIAKNNEIEIGWKRKVEQAEKEYQLAYEEWKKDIEKSSQMRFRYFKQATFYPSAWPYAYSPETLSTLYMAYICLCIRKRIGYEFTVQLGAPLGSSKKLSQQQRSVAKKIWSDAVFLADYYQSLENYLTASIDSLRDLLATEHIKNSPAIVIPEASAGLLAIREKLGSGMFLLVDIGGGTTDVAMCSVYGGQKGANKTIGIHKVYSFNKGLNFIFEEYQKAHPHMTIAEIQDAFRKVQGKEQFSQPIAIYKNELNGQLRKLVNQIVGVFLSGQSKKGYNKSHVEEAMQDKPIYLCGGGSVYSRIREFNTTGLYFSDKRPINKYLLNIEHLGNAGSIPDELFPIVATAYGLSQQVDISEELDEKPLEAFFNHLPDMPKDKPVEKTPENDFRLAMGTW